MILFLYKYRHIGRFSNLHQGTFNYFKHKIRISLSLVNFENKKYLILTMTSEGFPMKIISDQSINNYRERLDMQNLRLQDFAFSLLQIIIHSGFHDLFDIFGHSNIFIIYLKTQYSYFISFRGKYMGLGIIHLVSTLDFSEPTE